MKITNVSATGIALIKKFEGFRAAPYLCQAGVPTIGYGSTRMEYGRKVMLSDEPITETRAAILLMDSVRQFELDVDAMVRDDITQNQFDALVSFSYNLGSQALKGSTLLKMVNMDLNNPDIRLQFMRWIYADGNKSNGLRARREMEADLYFS